MENARHRERGWRNETPSLTHTTHTLQCLCTRIRLRRPFTRLTEYFCSATKQYQYNQLSLQCISMCLLSTNGIDYCGSQAIHLSLISAIIRCHWRESPRPNFLFNESTPSSCVSDSVSVLSSCLTLILPG